MTLQKKVILQKPKKKTEIERRPASEIPEGDRIFWAPKWSLWQGASVRAYKDVSKRASTCRLCMGVIAKKKNRVVLEYRLPRANNRPNGGILTKDVSFFHATCFVAPLQAEDRSADLCLDCAPGRARTAGMPIPPKYRQCWVGNQMGNGLLCPSCSEKPHWMECQVCSILFPRHRVRWATSLADNTRSKVCVYCLQFGGYETTNEISERFEKIREQVAKKSGGVIMELPDD